MSVQSRNILYHHKENHIELQAKTNTNTADMLKCKTSQQFPKEGKEKTVQTSDF